MTPFDFDVSSLLEETATAILMEDKLLLKTELPILILLH
jgi:hypothetical protein